MFRHGFARRRLSRAADPRHVGRSPGGAVERLEGRTLMAVFTVTTTADDGPGSLRQAILDANSTPGGDTIGFDIAGAGVVHTITPRSPLPRATGISTDIDGTTQPGYAGLPLIELNGSAAGGGADGLTLAAGSVRGLIINRFSNSGIVLTGESGAGGVIQSNYIGTNATGNVDLGNGQYGVWAGGSSVTVGGDRAPGGGLGAGNVISGNGATGVLLGGMRFGMHDSTVLGNYIGTNAAGTAALGNFMDGVAVSDGARAQIGSGIPGQGNVISGNGASGVLVLAIARETSIQGNFIGTDVTGTRALGNGASPHGGSSDGITSQTPDLSVGTPDSPVAGRDYRNVISANAGAGVHLFRYKNAVGSSPDIRDNFIGTDAAGAADLGNGSHGLWLGSADNGKVKGNLVSGNGGDGIRIDGPNSDITLAGNFIGTDRAGAAPLGNAGHGVNVLGAVGAELGLHFAAPFRPAGSPVIFGTDRANLISANGGSGVNVANPPPGDPDVLPGTFDVTVRGNFIGTDATGNARLGNGADGVTVDGSGGGTAEAYGNLVSANAADGIHLARVNYTFTNGAVGGNFIGTNAAGTAALGNGGDGVELNASRRAMVGSRSLLDPRFPGVDPSAEDRNVISGNRGNGVYITGTPDAVTSEDGHDVFEDYIGTTASGLAALGNGGSGLYIDGPGAHEVGRYSFGRGNLISGNAGDGVTIVGPAAGRVTVADNFIGTGPSDSAGRMKEVPIGNGRHGVAILGSSDNMISSDIFGGVIAYNGGSGVYVEGAGAQNNTISHVPIFDNGGLGIDLSAGAAPDGVTPNDPLDADAGPNRLLNFPVIRSVVKNTQGVVIHFDLHAEPNTRYAVEFFASTAPDPSGYGEGEEFRGAASVTTDAAGNASGVQEVSALFLTTAEFFTATARRTSGAVYAETSEFSAAVRATPAGPATVAGRHVFYNHSAFDGDDAAAGPGDDAALAPDKAALLPGATPTTANVTNYSRGINGIFVDINDLAPGAGKALGPADFSFRSVGGGEPAAVAPPASVTVRRGAGVGGSDRVTLVWPDYGPDAGAAAAALANGWLEVTVKANEHTGLAAPDVFAFGNLIGETGGDGRVNALDLGAVKSLLNTAAPIDSRVDFNHDGRVNALDLGIVKRYLNQSLPAPLPPVPAAPSPAPFAGATAALRLENEGGLVNLAGE